MCLDDLGHVGVETGAQNSLDQFGVGRVVVGLLVVRIRGMDKPSVIQQAAELLLQVLQQLQ